MSPDLVNEDGLCSGDAPNATRSQAHWEDEGAAGQRRARLSQQPWTWISHEMRTPLNAILGYVQLVRSEPLTERQAAGLATIQESGEHLLALINDLLDLASNEAGTLRLRPRPVALSEVLRRVADLARVRAEEKALAFTCQTAPDLPAVIVVDDQRLRQVLLNLVDNAIKFTRTGHVAVRVGAVPSEDHDPAAAISAASTVRLCFEVEDSGIGLSEAQQRRLFRPFAPVAEASSLDGGTGLGLAISRQLVRLMGGDIQVNSTPGSGSRFEFRLDLPIGKDAPTAAPAAQAPRAIAEPPPEMVDSVLGEGAALPSEEIEILHRQAQKGDMRAIRKRAEYLGSLSSQYQPFAKRLDGLARECQSLAIAALIERLRTAPKDMGPS